MRYNDGTDSMRYIHIGYFVWDFHLALKLRVLAINLKRKYFCKPLKL
jgi:hypothetical protein